MTTAPDEPSPDASTEGELPAPQGTEMDAPPSSAGPSLSQTAAAPARTTRGRLARVVEYFTLRDARAVQARVPEPVRARIADDLGIARQKSEAADTLWTAGHAVEALRLAIEAHDEAIASVPLVADALGLPGGIHAVLTHRGASAAEIEVVDRAVAARESAVVPRQVAAIGPAHAALYDLLGRARYILHRRLAPTAQPSTALARLRATRIAVTAMLAVGLLAAVVLATRRPDHAAFASAVWGSAPMYAPENAIDGRVDTSWLLPNARGGWLEVRFASPRRIHHLRVLNTSNAPHHDRATNRYRIELRAQGRVLRPIEGSFEYATSPRWVDLPVGVDGVDAIRFVVVSHHELGGGLSELEWE